MTEQVKATRSEIKNTVIEVIKEQCDIPDTTDIKEESNLVKDLNADSLETVELIMELEDKFKVAIPDEMAEKIQTVGEIISFIDENQD